LVDGDVTLSTMFEPHASDLSNRHGGLNDGVVVAMLTTLAAP
jgi:hypothetical protein